MNLTNDQCSVVLAKSSQTNLFRPCVESILAAAFGDVAICSRYKALTMIKALTLPRLLISYLLSNSVTAVSDQHGSKSAVNIVQKCTESLH